MVEATPSTICRCKIVKNRIVFCALHENAGILHEFVHCRQILENDQLAIVLEPSLKPHRHLFSGLLAVESHSLEAFTVNFRHS